MKHITTIGILALVLTGCDSRQRQIERDFRIKSNRVANLKEFGFTNIMESDGRSVFAERNGNLYKVDFGLGISEYPSEMKMVRNDRVVTLE